MLSFLTGNAEEIAKKLGNDWKHENRPTGPGVTMNTFYKGSHSKYCELDAFDNGWICEDDYCTVIDMKSKNNYRKEINKLNLTAAEGGVIKEFNKVRIFKWEYTVRRLSIKRTFINGRSMKYSGVSDVDQICHQGTTWFKWTAKKNAERDIQLNRSKIYE
jgi:hypothetical protein